MIPPDASASAHRDSALEGGAILVVDDEALFGKAVRRRLERAGYRCEHVVSLHAAERVLADGDYDLILLDMRLPDGSGLDFLKTVRAGSELPIIVMTAYGEVEDAVSAMKHGASDYLKKPLDLDELVLNVQKVLRLGAMTRRLEYSQARESRPAADSRLLGEAPELVRVREQISRIAALVSDAEVPPTVLICGETGAGKDVAARELHACSRRGTRPFVHVDCAALPGDLIEAELFGHVKGAFTHAVSERTGLIEAAEDGVVFLDEIGEIPLELQAKLLAVLERRSLRRLGSSREHHTAAWFIAATNRDVEEMVARGTLRADLYFRLNVLSLTLPPLRARSGDIGLLAQHFASEVARRYGLSDVRLSAAALARLSAYPWPGNVRELSHVIERAVLLSNDGVIGEHELALPGNPAPATDINALFADMTLEEVEKHMIEQALADCRGNVSEAARKLGITRMAMRYRVQKYALGSNTE